MPKRLAIEWDSRELRVVAGLVRAGSVTITDVLSASIESSDAEALGETLRKLLGEAGLEKLPASVALGRGKAELRELRLPPVPDDELPEMVRFEAMRSFANAGERSAIDFLPLGRDQEAVHVVAAAASAEQLKRTAMVAVPSQVAVEHLVLRPLAAASLFKHHVDAHEGEIVLVDLLADDADIVVLRGGKPVFLRSLRLPENEATRVRSLSGEIRRSLMACQEETSEERPRQVVLWGRAEVHEGEVRGLSEALGTEVTTLDPFELVQVAPELQGGLPEHVGRLAPLVGMLHGETLETTAFIDFLNPRRPPEPKSNRSTLVIGGVGLAAILLVGGYFGWDRLRKLDNEIAALEMRKSELSEDTEQVEQAIADTAELDRFLDGNVIWLDELRRVAEKLPPASEAIVRNVSGDALQTGGGRLTISGRVAEPSTVSALGDQLRDENHQVIGAGTGEAPNAEPPYLWTFSETVSVRPEFVRTQRDAARGAQLAAAAAAAEAAEGAAAAEGAEAADDDARQSSADDDRKPAESDLAAPENTAADANEDAAETAEEAPSAAAEPATAAAENSDAEENAGGTSSQADAAPPRAESETTAEERDNPASPTPEPPKTEATASPAPAASEAGEETE
jgi:Tfp pilus assembly PilM family ATPase